MSYADEFAIIDTILKSNGETRAVDAFALSLIKAERQARKLFTHLVYQFPAFGQAEVQGLRRTLAANRRVYFDGLLAGLDTLSPVSVKELIGPDYDRLSARFTEFKSYRDKIFHGQVTIEGLSRQDLLAAVEDIWLWCRALDAGATREFGCGGFIRNSFKKSVRMDLGRRLRIQLNGLDEYATFIDRYMVRTVRA